MLYAEARRGARRNADGDYVPLDEQDTAAWDAALIDEAEALLLRASRMGVIGRYQLEAAVQSAHVVRRRTGTADWAAIEKLYDALFALTGSPVVAINRAVAVAETRGARGGLAAARRAAGRCAACRLPALLGGARRASGAERGCRRAARAYERAIGLESDPAVRRFLQGTARRNLQELTMTASRSSASTRSRCAFPTITGRRSRPSAAFARATMDCLLVRVTASNGLVGWGEAFWGGWQATQAAIEHWVAPLARRAGRDRQPLTRALRARAA